MLSDDLLLQVTKPARYIGQEWNVAKKDLQKAEIKFALCFPDLYELGMSNLGIRIIYGLLNSLPDVVCERFFACSLDLENILRNQKMQIFSLESKRGLREFDLVGFSLGFELNYTNVLNMLELGGIPLSSSARDSTLPLVIGGGPCALNPEPMHEFFDLFVIGEAEEVLVEIVDTYRKFKERFKSNKISKTELLIILSGIEGVYAPSLYEVKYTPGGQVEAFTPKYQGVPARIKKRFIQDLDTAYFPVEWLVPYIQTVHDRIVLEVMRGCPNTCRFCQARSQYYPFRVRGAGNVLELARQIYKRTGYEEISLCGLSVSDYKGIEELLKQLINSFKSRGVSVSLPSIQPRLVVGELSNLIASIKKTGLTFAPEAATPKLLDALGKNFKIEDFYKTIEQAYRNGYRNIKLYFMIGLPHEEESDLDGIIELANRASRMRKDISFEVQGARITSKGAAQINISINALVPKPHTPLQWFKMESIESISDKQNYLKKIVKNRNLRLNFHNPRMSFLEGVLSRGDRRLSQVILCAFKNGARFDSWSNYFSYEKWMSAFTESAICADSYLEEKKEGEILPWDFLDIGISKENLINEFQQANRGNGLLRAS